MIRAAILLLAAFFALSSARAQVIPSRAVAATLDLSAYAAVRTLGYASPGDGGGATFKKLAPGATFTDQTIATGAISAGGSGYATGTYQEIPLGGGHGAGCTAQLTASGGMITSVVFSMPCPGYAAGDVLNSPGFTIAGGSGFTFTVSATNPALGSFTDAAGNPWQIVTDEGAFPNVLQFGAVGDWSGSDSTATNSLPAFMSAIAFAMYPSTVSGVNVYATTVYIPKTTAAFMLCSAGVSPAFGATLPIPQGVILRGAGQVGGTTLKICAAEPSSNHVFELCDVNVPRGQWGCEATGFYVDARHKAAAASVGVFYSVSAAQFNMLHHVFINAGTHSCFIYDHGYGGAANVISTDMECFQDPAATNPAVVYGSSLGTTNAVLRDWVIECTGPPCNSYAVAIMGSPNIMFSDLHFEGRNYGYYLQSSSGATTHIVDQYIGGPCAFGMVISGVNPANTVLLENWLSACAITVQPRGGPNITGTILAPRVM